MEKSSTGNNIISPEFSLTSSEPSEESENETPTSTIYTTSNAAYPLRFSLNTNCFTQSCSTSPSMSVENTPSPDKIDNRDRFDFCTSTTDLQNEDERLKSFANWPVSFLTPERLAKNGFYYKGRGDEVCCAFCNVEIMSWREGDDPAVDHKRWSPHCPLLRKQVSTGNLGMDLLKMQASTASFVNSSMNGRDECGTKVLPNKPTPVHLQYNTIAARLRTFEDWPRSMPQKPEDLADAGFYYTGTGDKTKCFFCDGGLKDWEINDDPWEEHALWFSRCYYVHHVKGPDYIKKVQKKHEESTSTSKKTPGVETITSETKQITTATETTSATTVEEDTSKLCKICYVDECNVVILPCGHVCACAKCVFSTDKCPICRGPIDNSVRLYFS
ncbi:inhibitor of apoptosis protein isoform 2-T2 [Aphomia sociella]